MTRTSAIIVAAGAGKRFGERKQFAYLRAKPVLEWTLERFEAHPEVDAVVLVLPDEQDLKHYRMRYAKIIDIVRGGERRQDSVWQGFRLLEAAAPEVVLVHDGARPLVGADLISRVIAAARADGAAVPALPLEDTVKEVREGRVVRTVDRSFFVRTQTPQGFLYAVLKKALGQARRDRFYGTDEAMLAERAGIPVSVVPGDPGNIKITTQVDLKIAEGLLDA
ncbi:MAG: 2-C-methyl-D-erythritol 4-phosphate cytidylyltransferase [Candidatus Aminicenantes bacterium RBG_16_63_14]|nr:MAG: 2-C-methyl-D-erythritol 4-phosphate cytidylyltransferase [Candidatus Aminicenantes bacterium RBG_16_63_14]OGD27519.1 MAG: 2-C-methyl-D-erythritol 4-phosphate cytidylyltransferase [Candidatus Aminicenantes bacterium RBG_19FT_COMBO_65_30]